MGDPLGRRAGGWRGWHIIRHIIGHIIGHDGGGAVGGRAVGGGQADHELAGQAQ